jgi:cytochrome P450
MSTASPTYRPSLVGDSVSYLRDRLAFFELAAQRTDAPVGPVRLGTTALLLTQPDDIEYVLLRNHANYAKSHRLTGRRGRKLLGRGILTSTGDEHLAKRRLFAPAFARNSAPPFVPAVEASVQEAVRRLTPGSDVELMGEMMRLARRTVLRFLFGVDAPEVDQLDEPVRRRQRYLDYWFGSLVPRPEFVPRRVVREHREALAVIMRAIDGAIEARKRTEPRLDLISMLCHVRGPDRVAPEAAAVRDEALVLTVTGHETLGAALTWTLYLLGTHPDLEEAVVAEARTQAAQSAPLASLALTERVLLESLRVYPPTWIIVRRALAADRLPSGQSVAAGQKVYLSQWVTHRDPRSFEHPRRFDPTRFDESGRRAWPESAYFPFGAGTRLCIGKHLALTELAVAVTGVLRERRLSILEGQTIVPRPGLVLTPRYGIRARVSER